MERRIRFKNLKNNTVPNPNFPTPPTPTETLEKAFRIAKDMGMQYVYLGNVVDDRNNTYCSNCGTLLIKRGIMETPKINLKDLNCPDCGERINIKGMEWIPL